jgi:hypothetical protein
MGTPGTSTRTAKIPPDNGLAASTSGGRSWRSEVTKTVRRSGPPKHGAVGLEQGSGMLRSRRPSGDHRLSTPADIPALQ